MSYVLIPRIEVCGANAQSAYTVVSGPSPLAFLGFARKLLIDLHGGDVTDTDCVRVAILHHDLEMRGEDGYHFKPSQLRGSALTTGSNGKSNDYVTGGLSMSLQPVALCNITVSLILSGFDDFTADLIGEVARNLRIAGGHIRDFGHIRIFDSMNDAARRAGNGYFMTERNDILNVQGEDKIKAMLTAVSKREKDDGWLIPINLGFLPITPFTQKEASRGSFPHAYAEPLIGIVQYKTYRTLFEEEKTVPLWRYARAGDAFVVSCK